MCKKCVQKQVTRMYNKKLDEGMVLSDTCQAMVDIVPHRDHAHIRFRNAADDTAFGQWSQINTTIEVLQEVLDPAFFFVQLYDEDTIFGRPRNEVPSGKKPLKEKIKKILNEAMLIPKYINVTDQDDLLTCSICLEQYDINNGKTRITVLPCGHEMHTACLDEWFKTSSECPVCRSEITVKAIVKRKYEQDLELLRLAAEEKKEKMKRANLKKEMTLNHQDLLGQAMLESQQKKEKSKIRNIWGNREDKKDHLKSNKKPNDHKKQMDSNNDNDDNNNNDDDYGFKKKKKKVKKKSLNSFFTLNSKKKHNRRYKK